MKYLENEKGLKFDTSELIEKTKFILRNTLEEKVNTAISRAEPGPENNSDNSDIPYYAMLPPAKGSENIADELRNPKISCNLWSFDSSWYFSQNQMKPPIINGKRRSKIIFDAYPYHVPLNSIEDDDKSTVKPVGSISKYLNPLGTSYKIFNSKYDYKNGPLDTVYTQFQDAYFRNRYWVARYVTFMIRHNYISLNNYNYTLDTTSDLQDFIYLLKLHPLAGVSPYDSSFWAHHMESLTRLVYWHYLKIIHHGTWIARWEDLPSLDAANDTQLNILLRQPDDWLRSAAIYTRICKSTAKQWTDCNSYYVQTYDPDRGTNAVRYLNSPILSRYCDYPFHTHHQGDVNATDYVEAPGDKTWEGFWMWFNPPTGKEISSHSGIFKSSPEELKLYLPKDIVILAKKAIQRAQDLALSSIQKTLAAQIAIENEEVHDQHEDYTKPEENPFLVYNPKESEVAGKPVFTDVSIRPGKQNISYTGSRYSLKTYQQVPGKLYDMLRTPNEKGMLVKGGGNGPEDKNSLLPLLALGAAGFYVYTQVKGG